jgi:hypothetical protein
MSYVHYKMNDIAISEVPYHAKSANRTNKVLFVYLTSQVSNRSIRAKYLKFKFRPEVRCINSKLYQNDLCVTFKNKK